LEGRRLVPALCPHEHNSRIEDAVLIAECAVVYVPGRVLPQGIDISRKAFLSGLIAGRVFKNIATTRDIFKGKSDA
jgi:hypothetical protein